MTANEMNAFVGREGTLAVGDLNIGVRVLNARSNWGKVHLQVTPLVGSGEQWVAEERVVFPARAITLFAIDGVLVK